MFRIGIRRCDSVYKNFKKERKVKELILGTAYVFIAEFFEREFEDACELFLFSFLFFSFLSPCQTWMYADVFYFILFYFIFKIDGVESLTTSRSSERIVDFIAIRYEGTRRFFCYSFLFYLFGLGDDRLIIPPSGPLKRVVSPAEASACPSGINKPHPQTEFG
jgi:hypothetical protein